MVFIVRVHEKDPDAGFVDSLEIEASAAREAVKKALPRFRMLLRDRPGTWPVEAIDTHGGVVRSEYTIAKS